MITHKKLLLLLFLIKLLYNLYFNNKVLYTAEKNMFYINVIWCELAYGGLIRSTRVCNRPWDATCAGVRGWGPMKVRIGVREGECRPSCFVLLRVAPSPSNNLRLRFRPISIRIALARCAGTGA